MLDLLGEGATRLWHENRGVAVFVLVAAILTIVSAVRRGGG